METAGRFHLPRSFSNHVRILSLYIYQGLCFMIPAPGVIGEPNAAQPAVFQRTIIEVVFLLIQYFLSQAGYLQHLIIFFQHACAYHTVYQDIELKIGEAKDFQFTPEKRVQIIPTIAAQGESKQEIALNHAQAGDAVRKSFQVRYDSCRQMPEITGRSFTDMFQFLWRTLAPGVPYVGCQCKVISV